jgi:hypothetical protein
MSRFNIKIGGLSMLIASRKSEKNGKTKPASGEVAMINPSRQHLTENDKKIAANHLPLLVVRRGDVANLDSTPDEFALAQSIHPTWVDVEKEEHLDDFVGWSVQGYEIKVWPPGTGEIDFQEPDITVQQGCNPDTASWSSLQWVANINRLFPQLRLDPQWRESPHVAARFVLGSGRVTGNKPVGQGGGQLKIAFGDKESDKSNARAFTDAILYETESDKPAILMTSDAHRWVVKFKPETEQVLLVAPVALRGADGLGFLSRRQGGSHGRAVHQCAVLPGLICNRSAAQPSHV